MSENSPPLRRRPGGVFQGRARRPAAGVYTLATVVLGLTAAPSAVAQVPADTVPPPDTTQVVDSLQTADSLQVADSLQAADSTALPDSLAPPALLPELPEPVPAGFATGAWEWTREEILGSRARTLGELLAEVPGALPLRFGDFGMPLAVTAFGLGGGRIRVFRDGFEVAPLEGGVVDVTRLSLSGLEKVRVERGVGDIRVHLTSLAISDPRPFSLVEVGTGDLDTNQFRGTFVHPRVLFGGLGLALDRLDTDGPGRREPGSTTGTWVRYSLLTQERGGLVFELWRMTSDRDTLAAPYSVTRSDLTIRARWRLAEGFLADAFAGRSYLDGDEEGNGGPVPNERRSQAALRLAYARPNLWATGAYRLHGGDGWSEGAVDLRGGATLGSLGSVDGEWSRVDWGSRTATSVRLRGWTRPVLGFSVFGELSEGERGVPLPAFPAPTPTEPDTANGEPADSTTPPDSVELPTVRFTDHTAVRVGATFAWRDLMLGGALLRLDTDSLAPLGLPSDRAGQFLAGGERAGWEAYARIPLYPRGLALQGSYQRWEDADRWRYLPRQVWEARLAFHRTFLPTGNLEIWWDLGIRERSRMVVPFADPDWVPLDPDDPGEPDLEVVPLGKAWDFRLQIRVVTVQIWLAVDNLSLRRDNQDFPGRLLPPTRSMYGVKWTLWN